ncbi:unnamed protein product, partial [Mesorhabditis belari]|uniref:Uncharacterized protein n=1 Tax=Mesorhabditis belari TaxID=2138241 RepID=A0AAF3FM24_9BILA
ICSPGDLDVFGAHHKPLGQFGTDFMLDAIPFIQRENLGNCNSKAIVINYCNCSRGSQENMKNCMKRP